MIKKAEYLNVDLVIIGGGGAGLAAALAAAENGCKSITVLEKAGSPAGSTAMAHDVFGAESPVQKWLGVDARRDDLFNKINEHMEALDNEENPIPGLYAAGATTGCCETESYCYHLTGHLLGFALNSGRIAGKNAVTYISKL